MSILQELQEKKKARIRSFAVLIDPDKVSNPRTCLQLVNLCVENKVDFSQNKNLMVAAVTIILGTGDFALTFGSFNLGGIGTATFAALILNWFFSLADKK